MLELSGGVRSLPQVPRWNAGRRARDASREPRPYGAEVGLKRLSAFRFLYLFRSPGGAQRNPGAASELNKSPDFAPLNPGYFAAPAAILSP